jgi:predicted permease
MLKDLRYALRVMAKDRWYSAVAVIVLSLGIGLNATVFTLVNAVLLRGLPYQDSARLYTLNTLRQNGDVDGTSVADLADWRSQSHTFSALGAWDNNRVNISDDVSAPESVGATSITANTFSIVALRPILGRDFTPADEREGAEAVVLIGHKLWKTRYAQDPGVLGKTLRVNGKPAAIVGVMADGMEFPSNSQMWMPLVPQGDEQKRNVRFLNAFGRIRPDVSRTAAQTELNGIAQRLAAAFPETNKEQTGVRIQTFNERFNGGKIRVVFLAMMGAVGFVLLIACANVANLQLTRSVQRTREVAVRIALGATRWRVVRQFLVESVVLGTMGGAIGLGLATIGVRMFDAAVADSGKPYWIKFTMDYTVFGFLAGICVLTGILFGLAPALQVTRTNVNEVLKEGGRGNAGSARARWMTGTMVVLELALTLVLLVGAGLMVRSFLKIYAIDLGIDTHNLVAMPMNVPDTKYKNVGERRVFFDRLMQRIAAMPGVESAALTTSIPPFGAWRHGVDVEGRAPRKDGERPLDVNIVTITPDFFRTAGVQLHRGRTFTEADGMPGSETMIVTELFAAKLFPNEDPIGRRVRITPDPPRPGASTPPAPPVWRTIVGISANVRHTNPQAGDPLPVMYVPYRQDAPAFTSLLVRSHLDAGTIMNGTRRELAAIDPDQPVLTARTMDEMMKQMTWPYRVFGTLFAIFAVIALVMSSVGLYAVMAYSVTQRTAEIGVRMALGAEGRQVSWLILRRGLAQMATGLGLGLAAAYFLSTVMSALLVDVSPTDPATFVSITALLLIVATGACVLPARRATRVDPLVALRAE